MEFIIHRWEGGVFSSEIVCCFDLTAGCSGPMITQSEGSVGLEDSFKEAEFFLELSRRLFFRFGTSDISKTGMTVSRQITQLQNSLLMCRSLYLYCELLSQIEVRKKTVVKFGKAIRSG